MTETWMPLPRCAAVGALLLLSACSGATGPEGATGPTGPAGQLTWSPLEADATAAPNQGYLATGATPVTLTLDGAGFALGDEVVVDAVGPGGVLLARAGAAAISFQAWTGEGWTARGPAQGWLGLATSADGRRVVAGGDQGFIYTSTDGGLGWTARATDAARRWRSLASSADGLRLVAGTDGSTLFTSADGGATWSPSGSAGIWAALASSADGLRLVAAPWGGPIRVSADAGATWTPTGPTADWISACTSSDGLRLAVAAYGGEIQVSDDAGATWSARGASRGWWSLACSADGGALVAAENHGSVWSSRDRGATWTEHPEVADALLVASSADGQRLAAMTSSTGMGGMDRLSRVLLSDDGGQTWAESLLLDGKNAGALAVAGHGGRVLAAPWYAPIEVSGSGRLWIPAGASATLRYAGDGLFFVEAVTGAVDWE